MKVTNNMTYRIMQTEINKISNRLLELRQAASSGKRINEPSDDPSAVRPILNYSTQIKANQRYQENMGMALNKLQAQDSYLDHAGDILIKVQNYTIHAINGSLNDSDMNALAEQVKQMKNELLDMANAQLNGRYIFAGYEEDIKPFEMDENGQVIYNGDDNIQKVEIAPGEELDVSIPGRELFLGQKDSNIDHHADTKIGEDIFKTINNIEQLIRSEDIKVSGMFGGEYEGWEYKDNNNYDVIEFDLKLGNTNLGTVTVNMNNVGSSNSTDIANEIATQIENINGGGDCNNGITLSADGNDVTIVRKGNSFEFETSNETDFQLSSFNQAAIDDINGPDLNRKATMKISAMPGTNGDAILKNGVTESTKLTKSSLDEELKTIKDSMDRILIYRGRMGIHMKRIETAMNHKERAENDLKQILAKYQDADIIETSTKIVQQETALKAALNVTSRIAKISILDYIR